MERTRLILQLGFIANISKGMAFLHIESVYSYIVTLKSALLLSVVEKFSLRTFS